MPLKELISIANELDIRGLGSEADQLDLIIIRTANTDDDSGLEVSLDTGDAAKQKIGKKIIKKLRLEKSPYFRLAEIIFNIGSYPTYESWIRSMPLTTYKVIMTTMIMKETKATAFVWGLRAYAPLAALAVGIPALAESNFTSMGEAKTKLMDHYTRENRNCIYQGWLGGIKRRRADCIVRPLTIDDYSKEDISMLMAIKAGEEAEIRSQIYTGTPPEILAYAFSLGATGDISELLEMKNREEPIIDDLLFNLIRDAGNQLREQTILFQKKTIELMEYLYEEEVFPDMPLA